MARILEGQMYEKGEVISYNAQTGVAVASFSGEEVRFSAIAFHSGRPARLPAVGDIVGAIIRRECNSTVVLVARLLEENVKNL